ncbi:putative Kila-N domain-containing protein [Heterosigma akashiwo virus 01]|jgi:hypothetical protein|uniref:Putative Kila-N domain-containing protein n=1 Tax=Heterosigma akashiwo virus 01 TaxID=97195 RepID=A0A1C9C549_HAV01|nr:putative Kila-N domain-containing protein [Heterosigma akashiwo virus 01]AOM63412.1 putative Kila-N domain-containing protein [Heterosigma akashiwo virus 01]
MKMISDTYNNASDNNAYIDDDKRFRYVKIYDVDMIEDTENGFLNVTQLCKDFGKQLITYTKSRKSKLYKHEMSIDIGGIIEKQVRSGISMRNLQVLGTYYHRVLIPELIRWLQQPEYVSIEKQVQQRLLDELCDEHPQCEVKIEHVPGIIDIITDTQLIEIKNIISWHHALGQVLIYSKFYPNLQKRIHLFMKKQDIEKINFIRSMYNDFQVILTHEIV